MKFKKLFSAALVAGSMLAAGAASAFPIFTVNSLPYGGRTFQADRITGGYQESFTVTSATTFDVSILITLGQYFLTGTPGAIGGTGLGNTYGLYALFNGSGTIAPDPVSGSDFTLNPGGPLKLFLDPNGNFGNLLLTTFTDPTTGSSPYGVVNGGDDILLATGASVTGDGRLTCSGSSNNCGSFGQTTSFNLTLPAGKNFFPLPDPFYKFAITTGQFNGFPLTVGATQRLNGSADTTFKVPEPMGIALFGMALLGLAVTRRRSNDQV